MRAIINRKKPKDFAYWKDLYLSKIYPYELNVVGFDYYPVRPEGALPAVSLLLESFGTIEVGNDLVKDLEVFSGNGRQGRTVWGIRNEGGVFSLEYYFYYPGKFPENAYQNIRDILHIYDPSGRIGAVEDNFGDCYLISFNPSGNEIDGFNFYRKTPLDKQNESPLEFLEDHEADQLANSFFYDLQVSETVLKNVYYGYLNAPSKIFKVLTKLRDACRKLYPDENPDLGMEYLKLPYLALNLCIENNAIICPYCFTVKDGKYIGLYIFALPFENFIAFLEYHSYPEAYIERIKAQQSGLDYLKFDIVIDFYVSDNQFHIKKTAFFGSL